MIHEAHEVPSLLLGELETDIGTRAQPHQSQQRGAKLRHVQTVINSGNKNNPKDDGPRKDLKTVKAVTG
jgi:hypothetical protein